MRTVLFYRDFRQFHGGHLKVWDYFNHVRAAPGFEARIEFSARSDWSAANPWRSATDDVVADADDVRPDVFFVAGRDWLRIDRHPAASDEVPVINLIQHVRHADPQSNRFRFLSRPAIRVCVSDQVADAVRATGIARGPVFAIPNSVDVASLAPADDEREVDVAIAALKHPRRGRELARRIEAPGRRVDLLDEILPRGEFLDRIGRARATVFLPNETEGFYLPTLEGMALGTIVVCPEHEGGSAIYEPGRNCIWSAYETDALAAAAESALALDPADAERMRAAARRTAERQSVPEAERSAFLDILGDVDRLWQSARS